MSKENILENTRTFRHNFEYQNCRDICIFKFINNIKQKHFLICDDRTFNNQKFWYQLLW